MPFTAKAWSLIKFFNSNQQQTKPFVQKLYKLNLKKEKNSMKIQSNLIKCVYD